MLGRAVVVAALFALVAAHTATTDVSVSTAQAVGPSIATREQVAPEPYPQDFVVEEIAPDVPDVVGQAVPLPFSNGTWIAQGPAPILNGQVELDPGNAVSGAIHAVVAHPTDADIMYVGAVNGGVWKTTDATSPTPSWTPLTDFEPSLSIGALEMDPTDPDVLVAGIGRFSAFGRQGGAVGEILLTSNGGADWRLVGPAFLRGENVAAAAIRGDTLLIGADGSSQGRGLHRSEDGGATWTQISGRPGTGLQSGRVVEIEADPTNSDRFYLAMPTVGLFVSDDSGETWANVSMSDGLLLFSFLNSTSARIAVAQSSRVSVLVTQGSLVRYIGYSDDAGQSWNQMDIPGTTETGLEGRDDLMSLVADPQNANLVYVGGVTQKGPFPNSIGATTFHGHLFRGDVTRQRGITNKVSQQWDHLTHDAGAGGMPNGGTASSSAPHADSREMKIDANGNLIEVGDGGITRRSRPQSNRGDWFSMNSSLQVTEFHSLAYDANFDVIIGGTQDTGAVEQRRAPFGLTWDTVQGGDGGKVAVDDSQGEASTRYSSSQYLINFTRRQCDPTCKDTMPALAGGMPPLIAADPANGGNTQFYTPIAVNANTPARLLIGAMQDLYESTDRGETVATVPATGGARVRANSDAAMVYGHRSNADLVYVASASRIWRRTAPQGMLTALPFVFPGTVYGVAVDPQDANDVFAIVDRAVFRSDDGGNSWINITGNIRSDEAGTFRSITYVESPLGDRLAVGTSRGVLASSEDDFTDWFTMGRALPNAPVWDLEYDATDDVLVAGLLGRGAWLLRSASKEFPIPTTLQVNTPLDEPDAAPGDGECSIAVSPSMCSLRAAIQEANHLPERQTIEVPPNIYRLLVPPIGEAGLHLADRGDLDITDDLSIVGAGPATTVVEADRESRVFDIHPGVDVEIVALSVTGGSDSGGGGIRSTDAALRLDTVIIEDNESLAAGGGVLSTGADSVLHVENSTITSNVARTNGGGASVAHGQLSNSTISGNVAGGNGGGLSATATLGIFFTTVADNAAASAGKGLHNSGFAGRSELSSSIVFNQGPGTNCGGATEPLSFGWNVAGDNSCGLFHVSDQPGTDPRIGPLADNGGPTPTHLPGIASPAIDNGSGFGPPTDQRSTARPQGVAFDVGAVEAHPNDHPLCTITGTDGDDHLVGRDDRNVPDVICGLGGDDFIEGFSGDDILLGGPGDDRIIGGPGDDLIDGRRGDDHLSGNSGKDIIFGGAGADTIEGNSAGDQLIGNGGNDSINGGGGHDRIEGSRGDDVLLGGSGNDAMNGGPGHDRCNGGSGLNSIKECELVTSLSTHLR